MAAPLNAVASVVVSCPIRSAGSNPSFPMHNGRPSMHLTKAKAFINDTERSLISNGKIMYINAWLRHGSESICFDSLKHSLKDYVHRSVKFCEENEGVRHASVLLMNALVAAPALAEEEKGKIFDFNLTLPIIAAEFLLLMLALDNIWFKPVAKVMDERDEAIRSKLLGVRDNSGEIKKLQDEAEALIKAARAETTAALNQMKKETAAVLEVKLQESKARIEEELAQALSNLEEQKKETLRSLDQQVQDLSEQILIKVIPADLSR